LRLSDKIRIAWRCKRDVPTAEVHILDAGHFALDTDAEQIADVIRDFLK
jgi:pimeloyl-ACP methyl ester carboxylesterase